MTPPRDVEISPEQQAALDEQARRVEEQAALDEQARRTPRGIKKTLPVIPPVEVRDPELSEAFGEDVVVPVHPTGFGATPIPKEVGPPPGWQGYTPEEEPDEFTAENLSALMAASRPSEAAAKNIRILKNRLWLTLSAPGMNVIAADRTIIVEKFGKLLNNVSHEVLMEMDIHEGSLIHEMNTEAVRDGSIEIQKTARTKRINAFRSQYTTTFITPLLTSEGVLMKEVDDLLMVAAFQAALPRLTQEYEELWQAKYEMMVNQRNEDMQSRAEMVGIAEGEDLPSLSLDPGTAPPRISSSDVQFDMNDFFKGIEDSAVGYMYDDDVIGLGNADDMTQRIKASVEAWAIQKGDEAEARDKFFDYVNGTFTMLAGLAENLALGVGTRDKITDMADKFAKDYEGLENTYIRGGAYAVASPADYLDPSIALGNDPSTGAPIQGKSYLGNIYRELELSPEFEGTFVAGDLLQTQGNVLVVVNNLEMIKTKSTAIRDLARADENTTDEMADLAIEMIQESPTLSAQVVLDLAREKIDPPLAPGVADPEEQLALLEGFLASYGADDASQARLLKDYPPEMRTEMRRLVTEDGARAYDVLRNNLSQLDPGVLDVKEELQIFENVMGAAKGTRFAALYTAEKQDAIRNAIENEGASALTAIGLHTGYLPGEVNESQQYKVLKSHLDMYAADPEGKAKDFPPDVIADIKLAISTGSLALDAIAHYKVKPAPGETDKEEQHNLFASYLAGLGEDVKAILLPGDTIKRIKDRIDDGAPWSVAFNTEKNQLGKVEAYQAMNPEGSDDELTPEAIARIEELRKEGVPEEDALAHGLAMMGKNGRRGAFLASARRIISDAGMLEVDSNKFTPDRLKGMYDTAMDGGSLDPYADLESAIGDLGDRGTFLAKQKRIISDMDLVAPDAAQFTDAYLLGIWDKAMGVNGTGDPTGDMTSILSKFRGAGEIAIHKAQLANAGVQTDVSGEPLERGVIGQPESVRLAEEERTRIFANTITSKFGLSSLEGLSENVQAFAKGSAQADVKGALVEMLSTGFRGHRILKEFGGTAEDFVKIAMEGGVNPVTGSKYIASTRPKDILVSIGTLLDETEEEAVRLEEKDTAMADAMKAAGLDLGSLTEADKKDLGQLEQAHLQSAIDSPEFANIPEGDELRNGFVRDALSRSGRSFTPEAESVGLRRRRGQGFELSDEEIDIQMYASLSAKDEFKGMSAKDLREKQRSAFESARANRREKERRAMTTLSQRDLPKPIEAKPRPRRKRPVSA